MKSFGSLMLACVLLAPSTASLGAEEKEAIFAVVSKVDGKGIPRVRRAMGTESVVGEQMELFPGDRVITDDASTVDISLHDGTIVRIGIRSEFKLTEVEMKRGFLAWVFQLTRGSLRSLVEKSSKNKDVKIRVNTPSGTMGIRGTEVLLSYSPEGGTSLFTLEGNALFGPPDCEKSGNCVEVASGAQSYIKNGEKTASAPKPFTSRSVLTDNPAPGSASAAVDVQRLTLFQPVARANTALVANLDDNALNNAIAAARSQLQEAQNAQLDRSENLRLAMDAARKHGTYENILRIAEAYLRSQGVKEDLAVIKGLDSGPVAVKKFAVGLAVVESGPFSKDAKDLITELKLKNAITDPAKADEKRAAAENTVLAAKSEALLKAESWARRTEAETDRAAETGSHLQLSRETKMLAEAPWVKQAVVDFAEMMKSASELVTTGCGQLCAHAKAVRNVKQARARAISLSKYVVKKNSKSSRSKGAEAPLPDGCKKVTVCEYEPCDTSTGKNCQREKTCRTTCR